jgi:hypothetical protein
VTVEKIVKVNPRDRLWSRIVSPGDWTALGAGATAVMAIAITTVSAARPFLSVPSIRPA